MWTGVEYFPFTAAGDLGILSTPVIDSSSGFMYVVACTQESGSMAYRLHAINISSGVEPSGSGVLITGTYGGVTFDASREVQRMSLALADNQVIIGFAAMEDEGHNPGYVGWVMAYKEDTLQPSGIIAPVTIDKGGGVWQAGRPPAVDGAGYVYAFVGNAFGSGGYDGVSNFSESVLKLDPSQGLQLVDWFTPSDWSYLDSNDLDISSSGPMLIPGTTLLAGGGKTGILYVLNTADLGKYSANDSGVVQEEMITTTAAVQGGHIIGGPVYWDRAASNGGPMMYNWGGGDVLSAYPFNGSTFATSPSTQSSSSAIFPGGELALSALGSQLGTGLVWATTNNSNPAGGMLHAFDAGNVAHELWNSMMFPTRDSYGSFARFTPPLVANGKVYVPTFSTHVSVYGLGATPPKFNVSPSSLSFGNLQTTTIGAAQPVTVTNSATNVLPVTAITFSGSSANQFSQTNNCGASLGPGSTCTINVVWTAGSVGAQSAWLNVNMGTSAGTMTTALAGNGVAPFAVAPSTLSFGNVPVETSSAAQQVTVTNGGSAALPVSSIAFSGGHGGEYSQTNTCGTSIPVGSSCTISIQFTPTSTGGQTATLKVSVGPGETAAVALNGTGSTPFSLSPNSLGFGNVQVGISSAPQKLTVTNHAAVPMPVSSITISGANASSFSQSNTCGTRVPIGSTCTISVVFTPASSGAQTATLKVTAPGAGHSTTLSGSGVLN
jgi:hypothetical protein